MEEQESRRGRNRGGWEQESQESRKREKCRIGDRRLRHIFFTHRDLSRRKMEKIVVVKSSKPTLNRIVVRGRDEKTVSGTVKFWKVVCWVTSEMCESMESEQSDGSARIIAALGAVLSLMKHNAHIDLTHPQESAIGGFVTYPLHTFLGYWHHFKDPDTKQRISQIIHTIVCTQPACLALTNKFGDTPLHLLLWCWAQQGAPESEEESESSVSSAESTDNLTLVKLFLAHGADASVCNLKGQSARSLAWTLRCEELRALF